MVESRNKRSDASPSTNRSELTDIASRDQRVLAEQVRLLYSQASHGFVVTLVIATLLVIGLWKVVDHVWLLVWFGLIGLITLGRYVLVRAYQRASQPNADNKHWLLPFTIGAGFAGFAWGLGGAALFPDGHVLHQSFLLLLIGGIAAGAAPYLSAVLTVYACFLLLILVPVATLLFLQGGETYFLMGLMALVFAGAMGAIGRAIHTTIKDSLRLRFENLELVDGLSDAKLQVERTNAELEAEVEERRRTEADLYLEKELAQVTLEAIGDGVITTDTNGWIEYLNPVAEQLTSWTVAEARGRALSEVFKLIEETTRQPVADPVNRCLNEERSVRLSGHTLLARRDENREVSVEVTAGPLRDSQRRVMGTVLVFHDVTEMRGMARRMSYQASHDALTGLVNRQEFEIRLTQALESAHNEDRQHAMCYLDLDHFKVVNDTCGHIAGDALLRQLATELQPGVRESDTLARLGGDEFAVLLEGCPLGQARKIADGLRSIVQNFQFAWQDHVFEVGVSIGVVPVTADSGSISEVMGMADSACYAAKDRGRDRVYVNAPDDKVLAKRQGEMQWVARIARAIEEDRIDLYGQQAMALSEVAQEHEYSEILIRMHDENGKVVPTTAFLPAAKRYSLMPIIDRWVIRKVCAFLRELGGTAGQNLGILAINLSGQSLSDERFLDFVVEQFNQSQITPNKFCFEITETAAIANLTRAMRFISVLKDMGCLFALDDFGSGLSSFAYLKNLQVDFLKIDGSFIRDTVSDPVDYAMVKIIHQIGDVMGIRTIAESVEQRDVLEKLKELGVDYAQGFEIAKPVPLEDCIELVPQKQVSS